MVLWGGREFLSQHERIMVFFVSRFFSWQSFLTHQSLCLEFIFFKTSSQSLLELWIPWLHEPDRCSAAQVRVTLAPSACQEAFALSQDYCSQYLATRQKHFCHRENTFLTLGNWKPAADSPWSAMPQYPRFIPILFFNSYQHSNSNFLSCLQQKAQAMLIQPSLIIPVEQSGPVHCGSQLQSPVSSRKVPWPEHCSWHTGSAVSQLTPPQPVEQWHSPCTHTPCPEHMGSRQSSGKQGTYNLEHKTHTFTVIY